jgi:integrase
MRARLSPGHHCSPAERVAPKTPASVRDAPLVDQLARLLAAHRRHSPFTRGDDWVFAAARGTPYGHRNVSRRGSRARRPARRPERRGWPPLRFHDLRPHVRSHLIVDSRILGQARITTTPDLYTHLFEDARHARDIRIRMAASPFARWSSPRQPRPAPRCSSSDSTSDPRRSDSRTRSRAPPNVSRGCVDALGPIETAALV